MINYAIDFDRTNKPSSVKFELYNENSVVPEIAKNIDGSLYTGKASGSAGAADWSGPFENGVPHGKFSISWGDRSHGHVYYEYGIKIDKA